MTTMRTLVVIVVGFTVLSTPGASHRAAAQEPFPIRPLTVWVGFPPGGGVDIPTRALAEGAEKVLGQKVVVVNKPGATGAVATAELVKARPDGYALLSNADVPITRTPHLRDVDYDPFRDLTFLVRVGGYKLAWTVREDSPWKTWRDAVEWARKNPGQLTLGHPGIGSTPHLTMTRIGAREGFTHRHVPFAGDAPAISALLGGHVTMIGATSVSIAGHVRAKKMRVLLVNEREGLEYAPEAVTFDKAGYADIEHGAALVVFGPKGLPRSVVERLERSLVEAARTEPFVSVARRTELILGDLLVGQPLVEYLRKLSGGYEELTKEAGAYKSERK